MTFSPPERRLLLNTPRIGPVVVRRLEDAGFDSITVLRQAGVAQVVGMISLQVGSVAWANRRRALEAAVATAVVA